MKSFVIKYEMHLLIFVLAVLTVISLLNRPGYEHDYEYLYIPTAVVYTCLRTRSDIVSKNPKTVINAMFRWTVFVAIFFMPTFSYHVSLFN